jgi:anti-anti-sigma regulatory factor
MKIRQTLTFPGDPRWKFCQETIVIEFSEHLIQEDFPEATVIRIRVRKLLEDGQMVAIKTALLQAIDTGKGRLILDFTEVEYLSSAFIGTLLNLRKKLRVGG